MNQMMSQEIMVLCIYWTDRVSVSGECVQNLPSDLKRFEEVLNGLLRVDTIG